VHLGSPQAVRPRVELISGTNALLGQTDRFRGTHRQLLRLTSERSSTCAAYAASIIDIMERVMIQLERESLNDLDEVAAARGVSRSAVVRDLLGDALAEERRKSELARVVEVLGRSPADDDVVPDGTRRSAWPS